MRQFSEFERAQIDKLVALDNQTFLNLLDDLLPNATLEVDHNLGIAELVIDSATVMDLDTAIGDYVTALARRITTTTILVDYLMKEGWLSGFTLPTPQGRHAIGNGFTPNGRATFTLNSPQVVDLLLRFSEMTLFVGEPLRQYVANKYRTEEDIRHSQILIVSWTAVAVAIILGLVAVFQGCDKKLDATLSGLQTTLSKSAGRLDQLQSLNLPNIEAKGEMNVSNTPKLVAHLNLQVTKARHRTRSSINQSRDNLPHGALHRDSCCCCCKSK